MIWRYFILWETGVRLCEWQEVNVKLQHCILMGTGSACCANQICFSLLRYNITCESTHKVSSSDGSTVTREVNTCSLMRQQLQCYVLIYVVVQPPAVAAPPLFLKLSEFVRCVSPTHAMSIVPPVLEMHPRVVGEACLSYPRVPHSRPR